MSATTITDLLGKQRGHSVPHLVELLSPGPFEEVVVGEGLETRGFADREAARLLWIRMDVVVPVFRNVRDHCRGGSIPNLHSEAVCKGCSHSANVAVLGMERLSADRCISGSCPVARRVLPSRGSVPRSETM